MFDFVNNLGIRRCCGNMGISVGLRKYSKNTGNSVDMFTDSTICSLIP